MSTQATPSNEFVLNRIVTSSTETRGRCVNQIGANRLFVDEPVSAGGPGESITPAEAFLAGVSSCGVLLVEIRARELGLPLTATEVAIEAVRDRRDTSTFLRIDMRFRLRGPTEEQARELVEHYKKR